MSEFKSVKASHGGNGWGGPLIITPTAEKPYVLSVTLGGISPVALRIAELTGAEAHDQFKDPIETDRHAPLSSTAPAWLAAAPIPRWALRR